MTIEQLRSLQRAVRLVHVADALLDYVQALLAHTRDQPRYNGGLSPRAALALLHSAQAWALMEGRDAVVPEDIQAVLPGVVRHRLRSAVDVGDLGDGMAADLLRSVAIP